MGGNVNIIGVSVVIISDDVNAVGVTLSCPSLTVLSNINGK